MKVNTKQKYEEQLKLVQRLLEKILNISDTHNLRVGLVLQGNIEDERFIEISMKQSGVIETVSVVVQGLPHRRNDYFIIEYNVLTKQVIDTTVFDDAGELEKGRIMFWKNDDVEATVFARGFLTIVNEVMNWISITEANSLFFSRKRT